MHSQSGDTFRGVGIVRNDGNPPHTITDIGFLFNVVRMVAHVALSRCLPGCLAQLASCRRRSVNACLSIPLPSLWGRLMRRDSTRMGVSVRVLRRMCYAAFPAIVSLCVGRMWSFQGSGVAGRVVSLCVVLPSCLLLFPSIRFGLSPYPLRRKRLAPPV